MNSQLRSLRDSNLLSDPVVFLCASTVWGIITVYLLEQYGHRPYQYHFLVAGISISILLGAVTMVIEELPSYLALSYTPLWISFVMTSSTMLHWLRFGDRQEHTSGVREQPQTPTSGLSGKNGEG